MAETVFDEESLLLFLVLFVDDLLLLVLVGFEPLLESLVNFSWVPNLYEESESSVSLFDDDFEYFLDEPFSKLC